MSTTTTTSALGATAQLAAARRMRPPAPSPSLPPAALSSDSREAWRDPNGCSESRARTVGALHMYSCPSSGVAAGRRRAPSPARAAASATPAPRIRRPVRSRRSHSTRSRVKARPARPRRLPRPPRRSARGASAPPTSAPGLGSPRSSFTRCVSLFAACCALLRHAVPSARSVRQGGY